MSARPAGSDRLPPSPARAQPLMHLEHEFVEMDAALGLVGDRLEGEVHQHRFAAPDPAPQIDAGRRAPAAGERERKPRRGISASSLRARRAPRPRAPGPDRAEARRQRPGPGSARRPPSCGRRCWARFTPLRGAAEAVAGRIVLPDHALQEGVAAGLLDQLDMGVERRSPGRPRARKCVVRSSVT